METQVDPSLLGDAVDALIEGVVFAQNPSMWESLYGDQAEQQRIEAEVDFVTPKDGGEFASMMDEVRALGLLD